MSKAEKFIEEYTRKCSNLGHFEDMKGNVREEKVPWLTPYDARKAVEIAREEIIEKACEWLKLYRQDTNDGTGYIAGIVNDKTIEEFRKAMED